MCLRHSAPNHGNKRRKIGRRAAQTITNPRSQTGATCCTKTGKQKQLGKRMNGFLSLYRAQKGQLINHFLKVWQKLRYFCTCFSITSKTIGTFEENWLLLSYLFKTLSINIRSGYRLTIESAKIFLVIKKIQMTGPSHHQEIDHPLSFGRKVAWMAGGGLGTILQIRQRVQCK